MHTATMPLSDGRTARLVRPDFYELLTGVGEIPSPEISAVLQLLDRSGAIPRADLIQRLKASAEHYQRLYHMAALCLEWPRLVLVRRRCTACNHVWDDGTKQCPACMSDAVATVAERSADELGPRDLALNEVAAIYTDFFLGESPAVRPAPAADDARGVSGDARGSKRLRPDAE